MIIRGPRPSGNFYLLDKKISEDKRLSWAARGMLVFLLGKPDHWTVSPAALVNETEGSAKKSGRDAVYGLLDELITAGYITRHQQRAEGGRMGSVDYVVGESCSTDHPPLTDSPLTDSPYTVNPTLVSIDERPRIEKKKKEKSAGAQAIEFDFESGEFFGLNDNLFDRWKSAFPATDPGAEVKRAALWLMANPANRKSNYLRFLTGWMQRAQDKAPRASTTTAAAPARGRAQTTGEKRDEWSASFDRALDKARGKQPPSGGGTGDIFWQDDGAGQG